jgi:SAM-dependent methyltransferase
MGRDKVQGTEGYAEAAEVMLGRQLSFVDLHAPILHLIPPRPSMILDIGAGAGHDAGAFAAMGHRVVAVEPTDELRIPAKALYPSPMIEWIDDSLPGLKKLSAGAQTFDLIMMSAVWMHLDEAQRRSAMPVVASLLAASGALVLSLRHGPIPAGRRMFEATAAETIDLAKKAGLRPVVNLKARSVQEANRALGVTWTHLAFAWSS